jgi:hypothetical protein
MLNVCWVAVRCTVLCDWKSHHLRIHEYNVCTLKIRLIHTGYTNLSNQVKTIHNDCPDITYKICMLHVLEKFKKTHHCLKSKYLFVWLKSKIYLLRLVRGLKSNCHILKSKANRIYSLSLKSKTIITVYCNGFLGNPRTALPSPCSQC